MKLNLGSGNKKFEGYLNIDDDPTTDPDYLINLDDINLRLPFDDNTVDEIKAIHVLEHIGQGFIQLLKEIYRVSKNRCIIDIVAPNEHHAVFYGDPTHVRPINANIFLTLCKEDDYGYLGRKYNISFKIVESSVNYDGFYEPLIADYNIRKLENKTTPEEDFAITRLLREANNVIIENVIKLEVIK
jgi:hypothetical protein